MRPSFIFVIRLSGSVSLCHSWFETFLSFRWRSNRAISSAVGSSPGSIWPASCIRRRTYSCQSSPVSRRTMLFIAASASSVVASTPTVLPFKQALLVGHSQHELEHGRVDRKRQSVADPGQARMVGRLFRQAACPGTRAS